MSKTAPTAVQFLVLPLQRFGVAPFGGCMDAASLGEDDGVLTGVSSARRDVPDAALEVLDETTRELIRERRRRRTR